MVTARKERYLEAPIGELAIDRDKMAFISGPRQVGKTTLAKRLLKQAGAGSYYTWDDVSMRRAWTKAPTSLLLGSSAAATTLLFVFDEIHKAKGWKTTLKGLFDLHGERNHFVVTGSARLNVFRRGGDSLLGRYLHFRLHPFSVGELVAGARELEPEQFLDSVRHLSAPTGAQRDALDTLLARGGFPEPMFAANERIRRLWRANRLERIIREDLRDLSRIPDLSRIEMLASLLPERVGSLLSVQSLREDLEVAHDTVRRWLNSLDELYYLYEIKPYTTRIARSLRKDGKLYLWDWSEVEDPGPRFENVVAAHLKKACEYWTDLGYGKFELTYLRDKQKHEVDFLLVRDRKPWLMLEAKRSDPTPSPAIAHFRRQLGQIPAIQVMASPISPKVTDAGVTVCSAAALFAALP